MLVLTKCGIFIGYLYSLQYELAFLPREEYSFRKNDLALDVSKQYCSIYPLIICTLIFLWLFGKALFYLLIYLMNYIRLEFYHRTCSFALPLDLSREIIDELWLLNIEGSPSEQLIQLDEMIAKCQYRFDQQLFVVQNSSQQWIVVLLQRKLHQQILTY